MKHPDWIILDANDQKIKCKRCGGNEPMNAPASVKDFTASCEAFALKHVDCPPYKKGDLIIPEGEAFPGRALVFDRIEDGKVWTYPRGGGFAGSFTQEAFNKYKFRRVTEEEQKAVPIRKARFEIDSWETSFEGYTWEDNWNGWACPAFEKKTADRIWALQKRDGNKATYDKATDTYVLVRDGDEESKEEYKGEPHVVDGKGVTLYPIGSMCWTWSEKESKKKAEKKA